MISLPIISVVCCIAYIVYILFKFGVPVSLSETFYLLSKNQDWLFSAWCITTAIPLGIYWFEIAPNGLGWMSIVTMLSLSFVGVSCRYKSSYKCENCEHETKPKPDLKSIKDKLKDILSQFNPKNFFKNGLSKAIHYISSLIAISLSTSYICIINIHAIYSTIFLYVLFILIGLKVKGVYNKDTALDTNNSAWIFFMEVVCFANLFIFVW